MERVPCVNWIKVASAATREREKSGMFVHSPIKLKNETALDPETSNKSRKLN